MLGHRWKIDRNRYAEPAALLACVGFALLALWLLVRLVWLLIPRGDAAFDTAPMRVGAGAAGPVPAQSIARWHLFGNTPFTPGAATNAPATTLSLILRGTFANADPKSGIAVIADAGSGEHAYRVGEDVAGAHLAAVYADHIVLDHEGAAETLVLPRDRNLAPGDIVQPTPTTVSSRAPGNPLAAGSARALSQAASGNAPQRVTAPRDWQQTVARLRDNPDELAKRVQIVPVLDGGKLTGVRLSAGSDAALMAQLGLRPGDIVTRVNGLPIDSFARGQEILSNLKDSSSVRVTVLRDGQSTDLSVGLQ